MPKVSIVIPVYNLENYIEKTLRSVFSQTLTDIEVIAVDDGSADNSPAILDKIAETESRLKVIHKENGGVSSARIAGIQVATGGYIGFVDGDDLIDADMYERLYHNAIQYGADISHCGYRVIQQNGKICYRYNTGEIKTQDNHTGIYDLLEGTIIEPGLCNKLYRRNLFSVLLKSGKLNTSLVINEDLLMNYFLFRLSEKSIYEDFCPYQYIKREGSASQSDTRLIDFEHPIRVRQEIVKDCKDTPEEELAKRIYLSKTLHKLSELTSKNSADFFELKQEMYTIVKQNRDIVLKLPLKSKLNGLLSIFCPTLFEAVNKLYRSGE